MANERKGTAEMDRGTHSSGFSSTSETIEHVKEKAKDAVDSAADVANQVRTKAHDLAEATAHTVEDFGKEVTTLIRRYPIQSLAIGFGVGLLLGRALRS